MTMKRSVDTVRLCTHGGCEKRSLIDRHFIRLENDGLDIILSLLMTPVNLLTIILGLLLRVPLTLRALFVPIR